MTLNKLFICDLVDFSVQIRRKEKHDMVRKTCLATTDMKGLVKKNLDRYFGGNIV